MAKLQSILIANRGEIASRIIRTCRKLGIRSIAVFSDADRHAPFTEEADIAVALGGNTPAESYLDIDKLLAAAAKTGAEAVHPGYGFLAENAGFAKRVQEAGLIWIGPQPEAIEAMGSKSEAKALMREHGVPVVPGYEGEDQSPARLSKEADKIGYPVLLKAVAGGGGKGMRIVREADELAEAIEEARSEAQNAFGNDSLLLEKYFTSVRHIEFQVLGDARGKVIHLFERECSLQRRYQKIIEESPSPALDGKLREKMAEAALKAAKAIAYESAGTVEFILDESGNFYFLEMNTRLQVEHPVTEMVTGLDLVEWQIRIAEGESIDLKQSKIQQNGYAIECRIYAEDPANDYRPDTGTLLQWAFPEMGNFRLESGVRQGSAVSVYYDPMLAKLVVWAESRSGAQRKMAAVLRDMRCIGLTTNRQFLLELLENEAFQAGKYDTHFLKHWVHTSVEVPDEVRTWALAAATLSGWQDRENERKLLPGLASGWRNNYYQPQEVSWRMGEERFTVQYRKVGANFKLSIGEENLTAQIHHNGGNELSLELGGVRRTLPLSRLEHKTYLQYEGFNIELAEVPRYPVKSAEKEAGSYVAPMPSQVLKVLVEAGQDVKSGDSLVVLSSMKMENTLAADTDGVVEEIYVEAGQNIEAGTEILQLIPGEEA